MLINENTNVEVIDMKPFYTNIIIGIIVEDIIINAVQDIDWVDEIHDHELVLPGQIRFCKNL